MASTTHGLITEPPGRVKRETERRESHSGATPSRQRALHPVLQLQRAIGNRRVGQLIQAGRLTPQGKILGVQRKLTVGAVNDKYEHEPAYVARQEDGAPVIRGAPSCPPRLAGEADQSQATGGILANDVVPISTTKLAIQDFALDSAALPGGVTTDPAFERFMSMATGDSTTALAVTGYTDCAGSAPENLQLRDRRADAVVAAMPSHLKSHPRLRWPTDPSTSFRDTNATPEGRARNRAAEIEFISAPSRGKDACDAPAKAADLDEYMFMVRCAENRLNLTAPADAPKMVSVMRQIYYGGAAWSASRNAVWNDVISDQPWKAASDPASQLGSHLFGALRDSQVVDGHDIGHLLTGLDSMLHPHEVQIRAVRTLVNVGPPNEEWSTWAGDVGSAAAEFAVASYGNAKPNPIEKFFRDFAGSSDLLGNLDGFSIRAGLTGLTPPNQLMHAVTLSGTFSEILMQYFRISKSALSGARTSSARNFVAAYGGILSGNTLTNRAVLEARLKPSITFFASIFTAYLMMKRGYLNSSSPPTPGPSPPATLPGAVDDVTRLYVDFLLAHL